MLRKSVAFTFNMFWVSMIASGIIGLASQAMPQYQNAARIADVVALAFLILWLALYLIDERRP